MKWIVDSIHWILHTLKDPSDVVMQGGYVALALIVFLETGAMVFFLPGDSLLVVAGLYAAKGDLNIALLNLLLIPMAILGDATSYTIGSTVGPKLFARPKSRLFRPEYIKAAQDFYEKHGGRAIILARFIPIVRTFVPVVAGVAKMSYRKFAMFNVVGGAAWVLSMTLVGYVLASQFPMVIKHIEKVIILVVFISILPGIIEWLRARSKGKAAKAAADAALDTPNP